MIDNRQLMQQSIIRDMSEGVMTIGFDGVISYVNPAAEIILDMPAQELQGKLFARCFFEYPENDAFNQAILDGINRSAKLGKEIEIEIPEI